MWQVGMVFIGVAVIDVGAYKALVAALIAT